MHGIYAYSMNIIIFDATDVNIAKEHTLSRLEHGAHGVPQWTWV